MLSRNLELTLHRAFALTMERQHKYATLEHLLLALTDDQDALPVLKACGVDPRQLQKELTDFVDTELDSLRTTAGVDPMPTAGVQRVVQRSVIHVESSGRNEVNGANVLVALFSERESHAVYFLQLQDMTRLDAVNYIAHGISKGNYVAPLPVPQEDYKYFSCFLSYSHADKAFCKKLYLKMK